MRVLSRRRKFAQGRSVRVFRGCGFCRSNGTLPLAFALLLWVRCTTRRRGDGEVCPRAPRVCALGCLYSRLGHHWHTQPGPSAGATPRRSRGGDESSRRHRQGGVPVCLALLPLPGRPRAISRGRKMRAATASGAGRRLLATASASAPPRRQRLPPCGFSHRGRGNGTAVAHARRHKALQARLRRRLLT